MARKINILSDRGVAAKAKTGRYADGGGLYLQVSGSGTKAWLFRFKLNKKPRQMGLGSINTVSLAEARDEALNCRKLLRDGIDPINHREAERAQRHVDAAKSMTFKNAADAYISSHSKGWKSVKHAAQWGATLRTYVHPIIGALPVQAVDTGLVTQILEPIWFTKPETAGRVRGRIEAVLDWAKARKHRDGENPARWKGHLDKLLPARGKVRKVKHHAALPYEEIGDFMATLREQDSVSAHGLEFLILTAARTGEVIKAGWNEIDAGKKLWIIPAERMKTDREHRVPLSASALKVLAEMKEIAQSEYVFPGMRNNSPLSNMAFLQLLKRMDRGDLTAHGFRSTFRDWASERGNYPHEVKEMALAHAVGDKVEEAYRRGDLFEKRRRIMDDWAGFCAMPSVQDAGDKVVSIKNS